MGKHQIFFLTFISGHRRSDRWNVPENSPREIIVSSSDGNIESSAPFLSVNFHCQSLVASNKCCAVCQVSKADSDPENAEEADEKSSEQSQVGYWSF